MLIFWMHTADIYVMLITCLVPRTWQMQITCMAWLRNAD